MGTHPIFESDFDCLTETRIQKYLTMSEVKIQKKRTFKKYTFRGVDRDQLLDMKSENLIELLGCRQRRHFNRGIKRREENFLQRLRKAKKAMTGEIGEKQPVSRHIFVMWSLFPRWSDPSLVSTMEKFSTRSKSSPRLSITTLASSQ